MKKKVVLATSWLLSSELPPARLKGFGFATKEGWPPASTSWRRVSPWSRSPWARSKRRATRSSCGSSAPGTCIENALAEQAALPPDALERRATRAALLTVAPPGGEAVDIREPVKDPVLLDCRQIYRRWAEKV